MALTYGFYNSKNHDRMYDAVQLSQIFDGLIHDGVYATQGNHFLVSAGNIGNTVVVGTGRAWFLHTWTYNDTPVLLNLPEAHATQYRYDAVVLDINANSDVRENQFMVVSGQSIGLADSSNWTNVPKPILINENLHRQVPLAYVKRYPLKDDVINADIISTVGSDEEGCPWVKGVIEYISTDALLQQAASDWSSFKSVKEQDATAWFNNLNSWKQREYDSWESWKGNRQDAINADVTDFSNWTTQKKNEFATWMTGEKTVFDTWFANIQYILDGDVAGHLQNEIEALDNKVIPVKQGGTGNTNGHIQTGYRTSSIYDEPLGLFSTSEGMFCVSSGDGSHAEGGGDYTYESYDAGIYGDRILDFNNAFDSSVTGSGSGIDTSYNSNISDNVYAEDEDEYSFNGSQTKTGERWRFNSFYFAAVLKNETTGEVLKHDVTNIKTSETKWLPFQKNDTPDYGKITTQEKRAINASSRKTAGNEDDQPGISTYEGFIVYDDFDNIIYKRNLPPSTGYDPIDPIVINLNVCGVGVTTTNKRFIAFGHISITLTYSKRYNDTYGYNGHIVTTYTIDNSPPDGSEWSQLPTIWIGAKSDPWEGDLTPTTYSDSLCWYMNGTNPFNSDIMVSGSMYVTVDDQSDNGIIVITAKTGYNEKTAYSSIPPYIIIKDTTDEYSLKFYYSYSIDNEPDYPLVWREAGESIVVSGYPTRATGKCSHAEGNCTKAAGDYSHAEGAASANYSDDSRNPGAYGFASHTEGYSTWANGRYSHAEGNQTKAIGNYSHAEGADCTALTNYTHVEGFNTSAGDPDFSNKGYYAHAEGSNTQAIGKASHAEGEGSIAKGDGSHAGGGGKALLTNSFVHGVFGFGGELIPITESKVYNLVSTDEHTNGCAFEINSGYYVYLYMNSTSYVVSDSAPYRVYQLVLTDGTNIEISYVVCRNGTNNTPMKHIVFQTPTSSSFPLVEVGTNSDGGFIKIPTASNKRQCQIIRIM